MARGKKSKRRQPAPAAAPPATDRSDEVNPDDEVEPTAAGGATVPVTADPVEAERTDQRQKKILALVGALALLGVIVAVILFARGGSDSSTDLSTKPVVDVPSGPPPKNVQTNDIVVGDGATAEPGDQVTVQYVGVTYDDGKQFDASWDRGQPFPFQLGAGQVIKGWDEGIVGMKVGGRRELIIPAKDAYGAQGQPPTIKPNAALVFVVDLLDVQPPSAAAGAAGAAGGATGAPPPGG